jgi:hypothetical protein
MEVLASGYRSIQDGLWNSWRHSACAKTVELDGEVIAMFGIVPATLLGYAANAWFLGSPDLRKIKKSFVVLSRKWIAHFLLDYPMLWNVVDARYRESLTWLESCGAVLHKPVDINGNQFIPFTITRGGH